MTRRTIAGVAAVFAVAVTASTPAVAATPRCFGAASRDHKRPCHNPRLKYMVVPTPAEARDRPNSPCTVIATIDLVRVCEFGVPEARARASIALVGDSHASHWRAALDPVADARRWRGLSITHTSCPLSTAVRTLPEPDRSRCNTWRSEVFEWFRRHPEVTTVFVGAISGGSGVVPQRGRSEYETAVSGYVAAWRKLPRSVAHILVIRDTPKATDDTPACIERALAEHRDAGSACARPRRRALNGDLQVAAATRLHSRRVRTLDLTEYFCGRQTCMPVIGGALVNKDKTHITVVFATTLGPYLLRAVDRALPAP